MASMRARGKASPKTRAQKSKGPQVDSLGNDMSLPRTPIDSQAQARVGRMRDRWSGKTAGEITPELAARVLKGDADLSVQMMICKRLLKDPHIFACMRNLVYSVARLPWDVLPFDEKSAASKKQAEETKRFVLGIKRLKKLFRYLVFGEFYPFVGAALQWNSDYFLEDWIRINPPRWKWDDATDSLRLLTNAQPTLGEAIQRRGYIIYEAELEPGGVRDRGLWQKCLWLWIFTNTTWAWWVRFAECYGNPYIWAFFSQPEDEESVFNAVMAMDANARAVFPVGTEIKLQEAQRYGTSALYSAIIEQGQRGMTKVILGHVLNVDSQSGSGTLAGGAAAEVSQENKEGVTENLQETFAEDVVTPYETWQYGEDAVARGEVSAFVINAEQPEDEERVAKIFVSVNQVAAQAGKTIDPAQVEERFGVRLVDLPAAPAATELPGAPAPPVAQSRRVAQTSAAGVPRIHTQDDVLAVSTALVRSAVDSADSLDEVGRVLWESYGALEGGVSLASGMRDVSVLEGLRGRADVAEEAGS